MLKTKQKVHLRSLAMKEKAKFQIGKNGLDENLFIDVYSYLLKHELVKISVLETCYEEEEDIIDFFTREIDGSQIEYIQHIGRVFVFYMPSKKAKNPIKFPTK